MAHEGMVQNADGEWVRRTGVWGDIDAGQASLEGAVKGYADLIKPDFLAQIGTALGGLNSIGALRSGATTVALEDLGRQYSDRIGAYAATTAAQGADLGLQVRDRITAAKRQRQAQHAAFLKTLGSVLGAGIGFIAGGPAGAGVGGRLGQGIAGGAGGTAPGEAVV